MKLCEVTQDSVFDFLRVEFVKLRMQLAAGKPITTHSHRSSGLDTIPPNPKRDQVLLDIVTEEIKALQNTSLNDLPAFRNLWFKQMNKYKHPGIFSKAAYNRWSANFHTNSGRYLAYSWLIGAARAYENKYRDEEV